MVCFFFYFFHLFILFKLKFSLNFKVYAFKNNLEEMHIVRWESFLAGEYLREKENELTEDGECKSIIDLEKYILNSIIG